MVMPSGTMIMPPCFKGKEHQWLALGTRVMPLRTVVLPSGLKLNE